MEEPPGSGMFVNSLGSPCVNTVISALPFLRIAPDARSASMGDAGIAVTPTANTIQYNPSNLLWSEDLGGVSLTYTPWLRNNGNNFFLIDGAAFAKLGQDQAVGVGFKYFNLGDLNFINSDEANPYEFALSVAYTQRLGNHIVQKSVTPIM